jgi:hypothetical protein
MADDRLTPLQRRILRVLAGMTPPWTLTGGGALVGIHLGHRTTRDLDLFWRSRPALGHAASEAQALLRADGLDVAVLRTAPMFGEFRVSDDEETCIVDLVAEPFAPIAPPQRATLGDAEILVDSMHEILVSKLTALLGRTELRDLIDVRALLEAGADLVAALQDGPKKDAGFSAITLAWILHTFDIPPLAHALGWSAEQTASLDAFRRQFIDRLTGITRPE